jgi:signal transduction histidine kinase
MLRATRAWPEIEHGRTIDRVTELLSPPPVCTQLRGFLRSQCLAAGGDTFPGHGMAINPITLERSAMMEPVLRAKLDEALVRELLGRSKGAGMALVPTAGLLWTIAGAWASHVTVVLFFVLISVAVTRVTGVIWLERRAPDRFPHRHVFYWFAAMNLILGSCLGAIVMLTCPDLSPSRVAMCTVLIVAINGAALVSMGASPLVYLLYSGSNLVALNYIAFFHPVAGLEYEFKATNVLYTSALFVMARAVHRSLRDSILLRLRLTASLRDLGEAQAQLLEASRQAGRADVARTVLHNVGNVLNSVNVSAALVTDVLASSKTNSLLKVVAMITQHRDDFARFFRDDPRAQRLSEYFTQITEITERDNRMVTSELESLARNIDHIKVIVRSQQSHVTPSAMIETFQVHALLDDALKFSAASHGAADIEIVRRFDDLPPATLDRHKALQILMNLFANARDAVMTKRAGERRIVVSARRGEAGHLEIAVEDTGCGIHPENLDKIFVLGFTTKREGHGLGLHFSACAARELQGNLTAHSAGPGSGAVFVLALPFGTDMSVQPNPPGLAVAEIFQ